MNFFRGLINAFLIELTAVVLVVVVIQIVRGIM